MAYYRSEWHNHLIKPTMGGHAHVARAPQLSAIVRSIRFAAP